VIGVAPPGFLWRDVRSDPPDIWIHYNRTDDRGRGCAAASVCVRMAAHDWSIALRSDDCGDGAKADRMCCGSGW